MRERNDLKRSDAFWWPLLLILAGVSVIKLTALILDPSPRLFLGDSRSYLYTALTGWIPPDRSFVYGFFVRLAAVWPHSLHTLVWSQVALSTGSAWLVAICLIRYLRTSVAVGATCSLLCAIEPLQLLAERYVLTETLATLVFAVFMLLCFRYFASPNLQRLLVIQVSGVLLISLRISFLPLIILCSFALPLFLQRERRSAFFTLGELFRSRLKDGGSFRRQIALPLLLGFLLSQTLLVGYRHLYGSLIGPPMRGHPALFYRQGMFLISDFAPIIQSVDYPIPGQRAEIFSAFARTSS